MTKKRDAQVLPIGLDTIVIRSRTWDRLKFEIEYGLQRGTTANSFLIQGDKLALIDPPGESFTDIFLEALKQRLDISKLDYVILGHVNPNRAVTIKALLELNPKITFICSNPGAINLRNVIPDQELNIIVVKGEEILNLGKHHQLKFITTPTPRWPDRMCTYDESTKILYTDKLFGAHVCGDQVFDEGWEIFLEDRRYYFDCLMSPAAKQIETALDRLSEFSVQFYAPGHGPLVKYGLTALTQSYQQWCKQQQTQELNIALLYASAYGNTATVAQALASGITKAGVSVQSINCEFTDIEEIKQALEKSSGFLMGSPTLGGHMPTPMQTALGIVLNNAAKTQLAGVFGSFGWSGEAIDMLESKLKDAGYQFGFEPIRVKFKPDEQMMKYCEEVGTDFAQALRKVKKARTPRQAVSESQSARTEQAVGRIVGSMSIVTTKQGNLTGAMLASWVSQATFNPPGLTIAVAKERAIESLMYKGGKFVLNILKEGNHLGLMKHFLKPFAPGEDRFAGVEITESENGCPILNESLAYLNCTVNSRMECGDHWLIYATVDNGQVLDNTGVTAVHQRKSGSHY
jgi:flavorubredoxin/flavin reductase (DIM6/NTAB) family NADH-FMN oxidoreductase RutF